MPALSPDTPIDSIGLSKTNVVKLHNLEVSTLLDASAVDLSVLYETIGFNAGKTLLTAIVRANLTPTLKEPDWSEEQWLNFVTSLVNSGLVDWKEVAVAVCGGLNPPQVGTAIASSANFQNVYGKGRTMRAVMEWFYAQRGQCEICGTRLFLEADHIKSKQEFLEEGLDVADADNLANLQLLCKRCNVVKRPSHRLGGLSFAPAQSVLIWILLAEQPRTKAEFYNSCRAHGLTMANIRFDEAWAFAIWLNRNGMYELDQ